jgi:hypothetical protein
MRQEDIQRFLGGMFLLPISGRWEPGPIIFSLSLQVGRSGSQRDILARIEDEASVGLSVSSTPGIKAG